MLALIVAACAQTGEEKVAGGKTADQPAAAAQSQPEAARDAEPMSDAAPMGQPPTAQAPADPAEALELTPPAGARAKQRVGLLLPLSGPRADLGQSMLRAAELALFDVADSRFELVVRDTKGTPGGAEAAARDAIDAGANMLLGPVFSSSVAAVKPLAEASQLPVIAFSNDRSVAEPGVYVMGLLPGEQVRRVIDYAASQGYVRFAVLAPRNAYGRVVVQALQAAAPKVGGSFVAVEFYPPGAQDVSEQVKRLARSYRGATSRRDSVPEGAPERVGMPGTPAPAAGPGAQLAQGAPGAFDAVMLPMGGQQIRAIAPTFPFYDIDPDQVKFLGTVLWNDPSLGTEPSLVGGWFAAPPPQGWRDFQQRYSRMFDGPPVRLSTLAYDATALAALLGRQADTTGPQAYAEGKLIQPNGFAGVDGVFRLTEDGLAQRLYAVMEMHRNSLKVIDPAPDSFQALLN